MKKFLLALALLFVYSAVFAFKDTTKQNTWQFGLGYQNFKILDLNVSPLIYVSNNGNFNFKFERNKEKGSWSVQLDLALGSNQSKRFGQRDLTVYDPYTVNGTRDSVEYLINPKLSFFSSALKFNYLRSLNSETKYVSIGGSFDNRFYYSSLSADVWFFYHSSISPMGRIRIFEKSSYSLISELSFPVFSFLVRQPYALDPSLPKSSTLKSYLSTGSAFQTINKYQQLNVNVQFSYLLKKKRKIGLNYSFLWMNYSNIPERNLRAYSNTILVYYQF